jgi:signal transduction histidine kinase
MGLSLRNRVLAALFISGVVGFFAIVIIAFFAYQLSGYYRNGYATCGGSLFGAATVFSGCGAGTSFSAGIVWAQLIVVLAVALAIGYALARWVSAPLHTIATQIDQFGPTSLGVRLRPSGPASDDATRLAYSVDAMLDRVAEGYEAQRRFAANASHELRTPLATQRALIEVSLAAALTPDQLDLLSRQLLATNERNEALIDGLLVLAETEDGRLHGRPEALDAIVGSVGETLRSSAEERGVTLQLHTEPAMVIGEAPLLDRLVMNLVQNAIKYNVAGGRVDVHVDATGMLTVANTGPRVAPEQVAGLFEPFRRASGDRLDHGGGAGLGLTIARSIVTAHHGTIEARANPDGGLRIAVHLPPPRQP